MRSPRQGICKIYGEYNMEREGLWRMMKGKRILAYFRGGQECCEQVKSAAVPLSFFLDKIL